MPLDTCSGPDHSTDDKPPARASDAMNRPEASSVTSCSARYRFDLPVPFAPVTTVSASNGRTSSRIDR